GYLVLGRIEHALGGGLDGLQGVRRREPRGPAPGFREATDLVAPHVHRDTPDDRSQNESTGHRVLLRSPRYAAFGMDHSTAALRWSSWPQGSSWITSASPRSCQSSTARKVSQLAQYRVGVPFITHLLASPRVGSRVSSARWPGSWRTPGTSRARCRRRYRESGSAPPASGRDGGGGAAPPFRAPPGWGGP